MTLWAVDLRRIASPCKCDRKREQIWVQGNECVSKMSRQNRAFQDWIAPRFTKHLVVWKVEFYLNFYRSLF